MNRPEAERQKNLNIAEFRRPHERPRTETSRSARGPRLNWKFCIYCIIRPYYVKVYGRLRRSWASRRDGRWGECIIQRCTPEYLLDGVGGDSTSYLTWGRRGKGERYREVRGGSGRYVVDPSASTAISIFTILQPSYSLLPTSNDGPVIWHYCCNRR